MRRKLIVIAAALALLLAACEGTPTAGQDDAVAEATPTEAPTLAPTPVPTPTPEPPLNIARLYEKTELPFGSPGTLAYMRRGEPLPEIDPTPTPSATPKSKKKKKKATPSPSPTPAAPGLRKQAAFLFEDVEIMPELDVTEQRLIVHSLPLSSGAPDGIAQLEYEMKVQGDAELGTKALAAMTKLCESEPVHVGPGAVSNSMSATYYLNNFYVEFALEPDLSVPEAVEQGKFLAFIRVFPADYEEALVSEIVTELNSVPLPAQEEQIDAWLSSNGIVLKNEPGHIIAAKGEPLEKKKRVYVYPGADVLNVSPIAQSLEIEFNGGDEVIGVRFLGTVASVDGLSFEEGGTALVNRVTSVCGYPSSVKQSGKGSAFAWEGFWRTTRFDVTFAVEPSQEQIGGFTYKLVVNPMGYVRKK